MIARDRPLVLLVGLGWPVPTFIARRVRVLQDLGQPLIVAMDRRAATGAHGGQARGGGEKNSLAGMSLLVTRGIARPARLLALIRALPGSTYKKLYFLSRHPYLLSIPRPDLIHLQWIGSAKMWATIARALGVPLLASARGSQVTLEPYDPVKRRAIQDCLWAADAIHCVSESIRQCCEALGAAKETLFVNYNGIDTEQFKPALTPVNRGEASGSLQLITIGSLIARKNLSTQLHILRILHQDGVRATLRVIGTGPDDLALRHMAVVLGIGESIEFLGAKTESEVIRYLQSSDLYLSTSVAEGLANSVLEAAACGLPVVAFDCEGMKEVIRDGVSGFVLPFGDMGGMIEKLKALAANPHARRAMGEAGREWVVTRFEARTCAEEMISHYRRIAAREVTR